MQENPKSVAAEPVNTPGRAIQFERAAGRAVLDRYRRTCNKKEAAMFTWQRDQRPTARPAGNGGRPDEAMSTEDFIREIFENERRETIPNGHELMEHFRDAEISPKDAVSVAFGNRQTLQRLYDQGMVKPESDAHFRNVLGMPPRQRPGMMALADTAQPAASNSGGQGGQPPAQGLDPHEAWRIREKRQPAQQPQAPAAPAPAAASAPPVQGADPHEDWRLEEKGRGRPVPFSPAPGGQPPQTPPPSLGADPHEDWRLRQKPQDVRPMPQQEEKPGFVERVGTGFKKAGEGTWDALVKNKKLHQGVEFAARSAWETSKTVGWETLRQVDRISREAEDFGEEPGLAQYAGLLFNRYKNPREAYRRIPEYRKEIDDLVRRIQEQRDKVYGKH